jgi:AraC-like DNA-binding protein
MPQLCVLLDRAKYLSDRRSCMMRSEPHHFGLPTASGALARLAAEEACAAGIDIAPLLTASGLSATQIADPTERLGAKEQIAFVDEVARTLGRDRLGFELGQNFDLRTIGLLYYVAASSDTLAQAVHRTERYSAVANEALVIRCSAASDMEIRLDYAGVARHSDRHQVEFFLTALLRMCRSLTGLTLRPVAVAIAHPRSEELGEYSSYFGCAPTFQAAYDAVVFPEACRRLPIASADPHLCDILVRYCEETLWSRRTVRSSFRTQVENAIAPLLPHGRPRAPDIAQQLHTSPRTLARRLADEGLTFASVLEEMRRALATRYLEDPGLSISQIGWLLGYEEVGAFTRAFRRWTGQAPTMMRRSQQFRDRASSSIARKPMRQARA